MKKADFGSVLISVLWICGLISWVVLLLTANQRLRMSEEKAVLESPQGLFAALGGVQEALAAIRANRASGEEFSPSWLPDGVKRTILYGTGQTEVSIEPEGSKVDLNKADEDSLLEVLSGFMDGADGEVLVHRILDFRDKDDNRRPLGAEKSDYEDLGVGHGPKNAPFVCVDELLLVPGVTPLLLYGAGDMISQEGEFSAVSGSPSLFSLVTVHGTGKGGDTGKGQEEGTGTPAYQDGNVYRILSRGTGGSGSVTVTVYALVRITGSQQGGVRVIWQEVL